MPAKRLTTFPGDQRTPDWLRSLCVYRPSATYRSSELTTLALAVAHREDDVRTVRCLIVGPSDTPYEFGFFEFKAKFGDAYPVQPPSVRCLTTNGGRCRFNPNIYATGKVCLSILGAYLYVAYFPCVTNQVQVHGAVRKASSGVLIKASRVCLSASKVS